jgi:hypothetical protein
VAICWSVMLSGLLVLVGAAIGMAFGMPSTTPVSTGGLVALFGGFTLLLIAAVIYLILALRIGCPSCGCKFLKNPSGFGPVGFVYHPSCPRLPGLNPWAYQIGRFLGTRQMRCIHCGEELFRPSDQVVASETAT